MKRFKKWAVPAIVLVMLAIAGFSGKANAYPVDCDWNRVTYRGLDVSWGKAQLCGNPQTTWQVRVHDSAPGDTGCVSAWSRPVFGTGAFTLVPNSTTCGPAPIVSTRQDGTGEIRLVWGHWAASSRVFPGWGGVIVHPIERPTPRDVYDCGSGGTSWSGWHYGGSWGAVKSCGSPGAGEYIVQTWDRSADNACVAVWARAIGSTSFVKLGTSESCGYGIIRTSSWVHTRAAELRLVRGYFASSTTFYP